MGFGRKYKKSLEKRLPKKEKKEKKRKKCIVNFKCNALKKIHYILGGDISPVPENDVLYRVSQRPVEIS